MTDPIADMLTRIRNATKMGYAEVTIPYSKVKFELGMVLKKEGFIEDVKVLEKEEPYKNIQAFLKYSGGESVIKSLKRISKPGRKMYKTKDNLPWVLEGMGIAVISTSQGLMTDQNARKKRLGGEVLCEIY